MVPKLRFKGFSGDWKESTISDVFTFLSTNSFSRNDLNYVEGDIYNIHYGDIHMVYPTITDAQKEVFPYINIENNLNICSENLCKDGDILLADASEDYDDIGKAIEIINVCDKKIVSGLHTIFMRDYKKIYANKFRGFMMNSNSVRKQIKVLAAGAKVLGISKSNIAKVKIPLPSLPEQTKIADFLSTVDDKIQNQQDKITHLENIKKGFMQKIFSRKIRFKDDGGEEFPEWEEKKLGDIGNIITGNTPSTHDCNNYGDEYLWCSPTDLGSKKYIDNTNTKLSEIGFNKTRKIPKNSIMVTCIGSTIGKIGICTTEMSTNQQINSIVVNKNNYYEFVYYSIIYNFYKFLSYISVQAVPIINKSQFENLKIMLPCLKEQQKIADFLSSFDQKISTEKEILKHLKKLKKGLLQRMFV